MAQATTQAPPATGTFVWNELMTRDTTKAAQFYTQLFGWKPQQMDMGPQGLYTIYKKGSSDACGMMEIKGPAMQGIPPHWLSYVAVDNVDETVKKAEKLGAKTLVKPTDIPNIGRFAIITDPTGANLGVYKSSK